MTSAPDHVLRQHHRRRRNTLLVWAFALALLATILFLAAHLTWLPQSVPLDIGYWVLVISSALALTTWFVRARRLTREAIARRLDAEWKLSSRLESSQEVANVPGAFASALRADAARHVIARKAPFAPWWHGGLLLLVLALLIGVFESGILVWRFFGPTPAIAQPAPADISASIDWRTPDSEIKATAIEEIPLAAHATTVTGFRQVTLEISINGRVLPSRFLDTDSLQRLAQPGTHAIQLPLYLDELEAEPFDIVAYHLRANRITSEPAPAVTSPLQFVQIRPVRDDAGVMKTNAANLPPGARPINQVSNLIGALKAAQLALLKQNFLLAHAPIAKTDSTWTTENTRVATDQASFADKVIEVRAFAIKEALPTLVVDNLGQVEPLARDASALIAKTENEAATPLQGRSLALIIELEKLVRKILVQAGGKTAKNPDPFKDDQKFRLPPRKDTPAGRLEALAEKQDEQTDENATCPNGSSAQQGAATKQAELAKELEELAGAQKLDRSAQEKTERAARDAKQAAEQLKKADSAAARSPSTAAAESLKQGSAAQEKAGRETALAQLDAARRALNESAPLPDPAARAARLAEVARQLGADARAQQETGSAEAARHLQAAALSAQKAAEAAAKDRDQKPVGQPGDATGQGKDEGQGAGNTAGQSPTASPFENATGTAAQAEAALAGHRASVERALRQLEAAPGSRSGSLQLGSQLADALLHTPTSARLRRQIEGSLRPSDATGGTLSPAEFTNAVDQLRVMLQASLNSAGRDEIVRRYNPDEVPPDYRDAVDRYFEQLSRGGKD